MTVAALGLVVDSSDVAQATPALQKLAAAATGAENAARGLSGGAQAAAGSVRALDAANDAGAASATAAASASRVHAAALQAEAVAARMMANNSRMLAFQLNDVVVSLASGMNPAMVFLQQGSQIAQIGLGNVAASAANAATKFGPLALAVGAVAVGIAAMTTEINRNQKQQVAWTDVVVASWQLASVEIVEFFRPVLNVIGNWWNSVSPYIAQGINRLIGSFDLAFRDTKTIWSNLPSVMGEIAVDAANFTILAIEDMVNGAIELLNGLISNAKGALGSLGINIGEIGKVDFGTFKNPFAGASDAYAAEMTKNRLDVWSTDYIGMIGDRAREIALLGDEAGKAGEKLTAANDNGRAFEQMLSDVSPLLEDANDPLRDLQANLDKLGALLAAGEISWEQYGAAVTKANMGAASGVLGAVGQITGALSQAFEDNKALAVANAVINTAEGVTKALAQGGIFGFASAAAIGISGAAQIASILSAKPGSASSAPVSQSAPAAAPTAAPQQSATVVLRGHFFNAEDVAEMLTQLMKDGGGNSLINVIRDAA